MDLREHLKDKKRIVIKIGSSSLTHPETGALNLTKMEVLIREITDLRNQGKDVVLVSSGAIAVGSQAAGFPKRPERTEEKQACAAIGQARLMMIYQKLFSEYNQSCAKIRSYQSRHDGRKPVVVAEFHLIGGNRVVLVYDRHHPEL